MRPLVLGVVPGDADRRPLYLLASGFTASAILIYALLWLTGLAAGIDRLYIGIRALLAGVVALTAVFIDSGWLGIATPTWRRQTPRSAWATFGPAKAALLWGLDAGLAFTTYRVTSLTWVAMVAVALHLAPWWAGVAYGAAFVIPTVIDVLQPSAQRDVSTAYLSRYANLEGPVRWAARALLLFCGIAGVGVGLSAA